MKHLKSRSINYFIVWLLAFGLGGCAHTFSPEEIREMARDVNVLDGVDRVEAILLSQDFLLKRGIYDRLVTLQPYRVSEKTIWFKDNDTVEYAIAPQNREGVTIERRWTLLFKDRRHTVLGTFPLVPFQVVVDAQSGEIINWGMDKLGEGHEIERKRTFSDVHDPNEPYYKTLKDIMPDENETGQEAN